MITISNGSDEDYVIEFRLDDTAPGCRVLKVPDSVYLPAGSRAMLLGYEPGISVSVHPVLNQDLPRALTRTDP